VKVYQPRALASMPRSPPAQTFATEDGIVAWLLSDPGPDPLPAIAAAYARLETLLGVARAREVDRIKRLLAQPAPDPMITPEPIAEHPTQAHVERAALGRFI